MFAIFAAFPCAPEGIKQHSREKHTNFAVKDAARFSTS
jgi:hypothetical protein